MEVPNCALDASGNHKPNDEIEFYFSESDTHPMAPQVMLGISGMTYTICYCHILNIG